MASLSHYGSDDLAESVEIDHLKQTLFEHLKEKESLLQMVTLLKNDFNKEESRNIYREIALEERIKHLDDIIFKRESSALEPKLYDGNVIEKTNAIVIRNSEETLMPSEESRSKMLLKQKGKAIVHDVVTSHPIDPELLKVDAAPLALTLQNNRTVHSDYIRHTQEEIATFKELVKQGRSLNPFNNSLDYA
nr:hypothetical protein [Tanacetum cinerariifolium]